MAFRFPLQVVLRVRQSLEQRERLRLALLTGYIHQLRLQSETLNEQRAQAWTNLTERLQDGIVGAELQFETACMAAFVDRQKTLLAKIANLEKERTEQERSFREARKKRKVLENLRGRMLDTYRQIQGRRDQQQMDDMFAIRSARERS